MQCCCATRVDGHTRSARGLFTVSMEKWFGRVAGRLYKIPKRVEITCITVVAPLAGGCWVWTGSKFEIDQAKDWRNPGYAQEDPHPVACVSWEDAKAYVVWLSGRTGKAYRLLTEAEWEYAARAGTTTRRFWGDDGDQSCAYANGADQTTKAQVPGWNYLIANCNDRYAYTAPVGSYRANAFGLYDMLGNVGEWMEDCWNENYNSAPTDGRDWTAGNCSQRVLRGGSWSFNPQFLRAAYRFRLTSANRYFYVGFRVARTN